MFKREGTVMKKDEREQKIKLVSQGSGRERGAFSDKVALEGQAARAD
jgi:hypothetical protein